MRKEIITISGLPGSGKSTIADKVADSFGWQRFSSGDFMRDLAHERGVTLSRLSKQAEEDPEIDRLIDAKNKSLVDAKEIVIDSRLAFHFIPDSFTVFLDVDYDEAARRIHEDKKETRMRAGEDHDALEETKKQMLQRLESERKRYEDLYSIDHTNHDNYRLIVDTTNKSIEEVTQEIIDGYKEWQS